MKSSIVESIREGNNSILMVTIADLKEFALFVLEEAKSNTKEDNLEESEKQPSISEWLTAKEVCEYLKISSTTLWRWNKEGYLTHTLIGGQRRFHKDVVYSIKNRI